MRRPTGIVTKARKRSARKHAARVHTCSCGRQVRGNGGWSSHLKKCRAAREVLRKAGEEK